MWGIFTCNGEALGAETTGTVSVAYVLSTQTLEGCDRHHNQTQKNNARGRQCNGFCHRAPLRLQPERDPRVIPTTELGHDRQQYKQQTGQRNIALV